ncbi:FeoA family protein [Methanothermococcus okinawensis]|uniref:FeoA family protein n=1 Tax=Methanothermococcus okinawensis (strain DSM 14208 / JCM 11175 / IH1) TaxID=647113 RepID=F8AKQ2_METOI|nr:FeoA family protein [Methanothermococcus okinawensis]AEH06387.1 FeoA family protein [Methanothermococcus okinawensis IH1]
MESLSNKNPGTYTVVKIIRPCNKFHELGIIPGSKITVISSNKRGPLLIRIGNCKMAIGRGMADAILVE